MMKKFETQFGQGFDFSKMDMPPVTIQKSFPMTCSIISNPLYRFRLLREMRGASINNQRKGIPLILFIFLIVMPLIFFAIVAFIIVRNLLRGSSGKNKLGEIGDILGFSSKQELIDVYLSSMSGEDIILAMLARKFKAWKYYMTYGMYAVLYIVFTCIILWLYGETRAGSFYKTYSYALLAALLYTFFIAVISTINFRHLYFKLILLSTHIKIKLLRAKYEKEAVEYYSLWVVSFIVIFFGITLPLYFIGEPMLKFILVSALILIPVLILISPFINLPESAIRALYENASALMEKAVERLEDNKNKN